MPQNQLSNQEWFHILRGILHAAPFCVKAVDVEADQIVISAGATSVGGAPMTHQVRVPIEQAKTANRAKWLELMGAPTGKEDQWWNL